MINKRQAILAIAAGAMCCSVFGQGKPAGEFPDRPVTLVVVNPPGGPTDALARAIAARLTEVWKQQVLVENRPGGSEVIGAQAVVKARPDGYTLLFCTESAVLLNQFVFQKLSYNPEKDLAPVSHLVSAPLVLVVPATLPVKNLEEFVALAKSRSANKPLAYGSAGAGGVLHLAMVMLAKRNGIEMVHIPYKGAAPLMQDLISGQVDAGWVGVSGAVPFVRDGRMKALVVGGTSRLKALPDTPVFAETSISPERADFMFSMVAPGNTPLPVREKIAAAIKVILNDPKFRETQLEPYGYVAVASTPAEFERHLARERPFQAERIKLAGVKPE
jgi:tripartite-type tricarboxylate transporter receptor subunit TctC